MAFGVALCMWDKPLAASRRTLSLPCGVTLLNTVSPTRKLIQNLSTPVVPGEALLPTVTLVKPAKLVEMQ